MPSNIDNAFAAFIRKKEEELEALDHMIDTLDKIFISAPREADKLLLIQAETYAVRLRIERSLKIRDLHAYQYELEYYGGED